MSVSYQSRCCFLAIFLWGLASLNIATASTIINVYGTERVKTLRECEKASCEYNLYMGSFKNKQYAIDYRDRLSRQTKSTAHLSYQEDASVPYRVYFGTFTSLRALKQMSETLLGRDSTPPVSAALPSTNTSSFSKPLGVTPSSWVAALSVGPVWERAGNTQSFYLAPRIEKTYTANQASHALVDGELFLGFQESLYKTLDGQIGLAIAATGNASLSGNIWDDADVVFNNYTYNYQVRHTHVAFKGKLLYDIKNMMIPWVSGSLGLGFNQSHGFYNTSIISEAVVMPNFASNTTTAFTYTLGLGAQRQLSQHYQAGIGYEFADWGKSSLNRAPGQSLNSGLSLSHLYTNGFLLNFTYVS